MKTANLDIPHSAADRSKSWRCVGCGVLSPNRLRSCECPTSVVRGPHGLTDWKVEPYDNAASEQVARWMISNSYATGHGDTIEDMLIELESQAKERGKREIASLVGPSDPTPPDREAWPNGCRNPNSCSIHRDCMYLGCTHYDRDISGEIDAALRGGE